jgi:uncharacterized integral membrane protein (TIGR00697 family)
MTLFEKIYTGLCILFSVLIVLGNLTYQKFVALPLGGLHLLELSVGALLYPLTFLITDLIAEFYGPERARFCIRFAIFINCLVVLILFGMDRLRATEWSTLDDNAFHRAFGVYGIAFIGSTLAFYISQSIDIRLYLWIREKTNGRYLWLRNNGSTAVSLFLDTCIVLGVMTVFGVFSIDRLGVLVASSYCFKLFFTIVCTPLFYGCVFVTKKLVD